ncbi:MAG: hypothetical protein ACP5MH_07225 [Thermoproteus sp.]
MDVFLTASEIYNYCANGGDATYCQEHREWYCLGLAKALADCASRFGRVECREEDIDVDEAAKKVAEACGVKAEDIVSCLEQYGRQAARLMPLASLLGIEIPDCVRKILEKY